MAVASVFSLGHRRWEPPEDPSHTCSALNRTSCPARAAQTLEAGCWARNPISWLLHHTCPAIPPQTHVCPKACSVQAHSLLSLLSARSVACGTQLSEPPKAHRPLPLLTHHVCVTGPACMRGSPWQPSRTTHPWLCQALCIQAKGTRLASVGRPGLGHTYRGMRGPGAVLKWYSQGPRGHTGRERGGRARQDTNRWARPPRAAAWEDPHHLRGSAARRGPPAQWTLGFLGSGEERGQ